ncbi:MAG: hypothetical protein N2Z62_06350 [Rhodobacteraceae bacterium]|nr:hypothetical protein [Paracoccaceae bacterium]
MILILVILPLVVFVALALLPRGRPAALGLGIAAVVLAGFWATTGEGEGGDLGRVALTMAAAGVVMAALAQGLRLALPRDAPRRRCGAVMAAVAIAVSAAGYRAIGGFG